MDDENASCAHDDEEYAQLSLLHLPVEVFLHIGSFLDASTLHSLSSVCKQFDLVLNDADSLWKKRINDILWPNATDSLFCPARPNKLFWKLSCVAIEKQTALWKQHNSMENLRFLEPYNATSVLLMSVNGITYLVGTEDRSLFYKKLSYGKEPFHEVEAIDVKSPYGLGSLTAINHTVYNCCPDNTVKSWVLTNIGLVHDRTYILKCGFKLRCDLRDVSSCPEQALFATGSFDGTIYVFDSRSSSNKPYRQYRPHTTDVTKLVMNTEYILSASKDKTVSVWDQRAGRTMKSITIPDEATPTCMSMRRDNWVCVGDTKAKLHMLNPKNNLELVKSYSTEHTRAITGVYLTRGCLITSSYDGTVRISSPTDPPRSIATLVHCTEPRTISQRESFDEHPYNMLDMTQSVCSKYEGCLRPLGTDRCHQNRISDWTAQSHMVCVLFPSEMNAKIFSMDYLNDTLAVSGQGIEIWRPKN